MSTLTVAQARQHIETDLVDDALQRLIDDAEAEIASRLGSNAAQTEVLEAGEPYLWLARKAASITSIVERFLHTDYALATDDYKLHADGYRLERLHDGTNPALWFRGIVTIVYATVATAAQRLRLTIDLVKLSARYEGLKAASVGDISTTFLDDYQKERESLFRALNSGGRRQLA